MGDRPLFSIIMPVFNVEKYLRHSIESVLNQDLKNFELILIDDCSTDHSGEICDYYANQDNRIRVIHKENNEGLGEARNTGLKVCLGQWIMFIDSDDWIADNTLVELKTNVCNNVLADIIVYGYAQEFEQKDREDFFSAEVTPEKRSLSNTKDIANAVIELDLQRCFSYAWNKIYKRNLILDNGFQFTSTPLIEDFLFNIEVFKKCKTLMILDNVFYHYRKPRHETLVSKYVNGFYDLCKMKYKKEKELLIQNGTFDQPYTEMLIVIHMKHILSSYMKECSKKSKNNIAEQYKSVEKILKDPVTIESVAYLHTTNKKMQILKKIIQSQNVFINFFAAKIAIIIQQKMPKVWQLFL